MSTNNPTESQTRSAHIPDCLSPEDVEFLVNNPGQTRSNGSAPATIIQAQRTVDISEPASKGVRPQIGGHKAGAGKIGVSKNLATKLADGDAVNRAELARQDAEKQAHQAAVEETSADKVLARLNYLERTVKQQAKQIRELRND